MNEVKQSELTFHLMVEAAPNALVLINKSGLIVFVNIKAEKLFGYVWEEFIGQPIELLIPNRFHIDHVKYRSNFFDDVKARHMGLGRELYAKHKNGSEFPIEIGLNPVVTVDGTLILASIIDITERKQNELRFRQVVESAPNAMILMNETGTITLANREAEILFGYNREEMIGNKIEMIIPHRYREKHETYRNTYLKNPSIRPMGAGRSMYALRKDGTEIPVEIGLNPITDNRNSTILASIVDITERKKQEINRLKGDFLANMSHELRTPINAILGFTDLLKNEACGTLNTEQEECIDGICISGKHLLQLVNDVLDISNIEIGKPSFNPTVFSIKDIISDVVKTLRPLIDKNKIVISCNFSETINIAYLDKDKFVQVLYNLLSNAIKFNRENGQITVTIEPGTDGFFILSVNDTGIGIAEEDIPKLFVPFAQLNKSGKHKGSGLGLAITKKLVRLQGGSISVDSKVHVGTTFIVVLPTYYVSPISSEQHTTHIQ